MQNMLTELMDREKIRDCMMRYAQAVDRMDVALLKSVYWPDGNDWHGSFNGNAHEFADWIIPELTRTTVRCQHFLGGSLIRFTEPKKAHVETYSQNYHTMRREDDENYDLVVGSRYIDKMEKRGNEWRIFSRIVMVEWVGEATKSVDLDATGPGSANAELNAGDAPISKRKPDDMLYSFLGSGPIKSLAETLLG